MKKITNLIIATLLLATFTISFASAQEQDSLANVRNYHKIEILQLQIKDMEEGLSDFNIQIETLNKVNDSILDNFKDPVDTAIVSSNRMRIEAYSKGIDDINDSINQIKIKIENLSSGKESAIVSIENNDKSRVDTIEIGNKPYFRYQHKRNNNSFNGHLSGTFIGINSFINSDGQIDAPADAPFMDLNESRSLEVSFSCCELNIPFSKNTGLTTGFEFQIHHYSFKKTFDLKIDDNSMVYADYTSPEVDKFKRFNLRTVYFCLPVQFEWQIPVKNDKIFINAGIDGGIRIGSRTKQIYKLDGERKKNVERSDFETNLLRYEFFGGIGYKSTEIFVKYSPQPFFIDNHGPELYPISVGIKFDI